MPNAFYAQSGGVTAVINATAAGVIETARQYPDAIGTVFAGRNGVLGALEEALYDTRQLSDHEIQALRRSPGAAFGSCRYRLADGPDGERELQRLLDVFAAHDIRYVLYNGGGDSADTCLKIARLAQARGVPLQAIHLPKTIDNDLPLTDCSPGFGSAAKYVATSVMEVGRDVDAMRRTATRVFVLEVLGRHAGWTAAAAALAAASRDDPPHLLLLPERPLCPERLIEQVHSCEQTYGFCVLVVSEGVRDLDGHLLSASKTQDAFGHPQLGGAGQQIATRIREHLQLKTHVAVADYLMRSAAHHVSATDQAQAYAVGEAGIRAALAGANNIMISLERLSDQPYAWRTGEAPLAQVANREKQLPDHYISDDGWHITSACRRYLQPLIVGESPPPYANGLPCYVKLRLQRAPCRLAPWPPR